MNRLLTRNLHSFNFVWLLLSFISSLLPQTQAQSGLDVLDPSTPFQQCGISQIRWQGSRGISRVAVVDGEWMSGSKSSFARATGMSAGMIAQPRPTQRLEFSWSFLLKYRKREGMHVEMWRSATSSLEASIPYNYSSNWDRGGEKLP